MRRDYIKEALDMGSRHFKDKQEIVMPVRREINAYIREYWCEDKEDRHKEKMLYDKMCLVCGEEIETSLTAEQWNAAFDCITFRMLELEDAKALNPHAEEFIQRKINGLEEILTIIGPYSV